MFCKFLAASAIAVSFCSAAESAIIHSYYVKYEYTFYNDLIVHDDFTNTLLYEGDFDSRDDHIWGLPLASDAIDEENGDRLYRFMAYEENGSIICTIAGVDCSVWNYKDDYWAYANSDLTYFGSELMNIRIADGKIDLYDVDNAMGHSYYNEAIDKTITASDRGRHTYFEIVQPAPVPLPASFAMLPVGVAALAMVRRRRKVS